MNYLTSTLAIFGLMYAFGFSTLSLPFRKALETDGPSWRNFFLMGLECPACSSFHYGWFATYFGLTPFSNSPSQLVTAAFFYSATSLLLARIAGLQNGN